MVGLKRLDDLQACIESAVADGVAGDVIEAGVWRGGASMLARATLDSLGEIDRTVWVADSFRGLPPPGHRSVPGGSASSISARWTSSSSRLDEVRGYFARFGLDRGVEFVEGFFGDTLPRLRGLAWSVIRLDGDTYEATWAGLESLYPSLSAGGYRDRRRLPPDQGVRAAVDEFPLASTGSPRRIQGIDWVGARWRREDDPEPSALSPASRSPDVEPERLGARKRPVRTAIRGAASRFERELELRARAGATAGRGADVIVFGTAVTDARDVRSLRGTRHRARSRARLGRPSTQSAGSVFRNYNLLLDKAAAHDDLEALVLLHQDVEIADADFAAKVRKALADPDVAIVGCAGAVGSRSIAWWQGAMTWASMTHRYPEYGGGEFPAISWHPDAVPSWRQARGGGFDRRLDHGPVALGRARACASMSRSGTLHGYDFDICMQAKAPARRWLRPPFPGRSITARST